MSACVPVEHRHRALKNDNRVYTCTCIPGNQIYNNNRITELKIVYNALISYSNNSIYLAWFISKEIVTASVYLYFDYCQCIHVDL